MIVSAASADDGTFAPQVLGRLTVEHRTRLDKVWADGKYHNNHLNEWLTTTKAGYQIKVVNRPVGSKTFILLQRRWVVERTFAWLGRYRRDSRAYEVYTESSEAMIKVSSMHLMINLPRPKRSKVENPFNYRRFSDFITE
jgi:putative transposase